MDDSSTISSPRGDIAKLRQILHALAPVTVAFSGGADSAFLAWIAADTLGAKRAGAVTAVSASLPAAELEHCRQLAADWGLDWSTVTTDELDNPDYRANAGDRCAHCKTALTDALALVVDTEATVLLGVNVDDLGDHRPGQEAARAAGARFPLVEAGFTKADVRRFSQLLGLSTWDRPAAACLASRLPYGTEVTAEVLAQVESAEAALHALGFDDLRVRHYGDTARIEVPLHRIEGLVAERAEVVPALRRAGYTYVTVDLEGLRSGNLNQALDLRDTPAVAANPPQPGRVSVAPPTRR